MSVTELQNQLASLPLEERRQLTAFLVSLRHQELADYKESLALKIDDTNEANWISLEEFDRRVSA